MGEDLCTIITTTCNNFVLLSTRHKVVSLHQGKEACYQAYNTRQRLCSGHGRIRRRRCRPPRSGRR